MPDETLPDQIANQLRRDILRGVLAPGATIKERDNAADLGVSRTPMREAIRILAKEGLLQLRPARSPIVANPSWKEISDCIDVVRALEQLSGSQACERASDDEIEAIAQIQARMEAESDTMDEVELFEIDMAFHVAIVQASHNSALTELHGALLSRLWRARYLGSRMGRDQSRVFREHREIIDGLRRRDASAVQSDMLSHLERLKDQIHQFFDAEADAQDREKQAAR